MLLTLWNIILILQDQRVNTLRPRQNGRRFADDTFKHIFLNENVRISIKISLKFVPKGPINNNPSLVQIMAWRRSGDKPLSEPMMVSLLTHICVTRPQWVKRQGTTIFFTNPSKHTNKQGFISIIRLSILQRNLIFKDVVAIIMEQVLCHNIHQYFEILS